MCVWSYAYNYGRLCYGTGCVVTGVWCTAESLEMCVNSFKAFAYFQSYSSAWQIPSWFLWFFFSYHCLYKSTKVKRVLYSFVYVSVREKTTCELHRESALGATANGGQVFSLPRPAVGQYVPTCDQNGAYTPMQCHGGIGQCWCVYPSGEEISGTRTGPGSRPSCKQKSVLSHKLLALSSQSDR